ncbi:hypothetical protein LBMAG21_12140 [Armatimonadota bacterium]|nr:hypothetical protein LBMAG21_12140 [Armatimonadota bacterium]
MEGSTNRIAKKPKHYSLEWAQANEKRVIVFLLCAYFALRLFGLADAGLNRLYDEGVYLSMMSLESSGKAYIYKDIIFGRPPAVIWVGAWFWGKVHGSIFAIRCLYICFNLLGFMPVYLLAKRFFNTRIALLALFLMTTAPGFSNWLGRNVFLELPQNVLLYWGLWFLLCVRKPWAAATAGGLVALSFLVKETAIPLIFALLVSLLAAEYAPRRLFPMMEENDKPIKHSWLWMGAGFFAVMGLLLLYLSRIPNCLHYFASFYFPKRYSSDSYQMRQHFYEWINGFYALSIPFTFGVLGTLWLAWKPRHRTDLFVSLFALMYAFIIFWVPARFYWRYFVTVTPIFCIAVGVWWERFRAVERPATLRGIVNIFQTLFTLVAFASLLLYHIKESPTPEPYQVALLALDKCPQPVFALDPIWNVVSGKELMVWEHVGGDVFGRQIAMKADPKATIALIDSCPSVVLDHDSWLFLREIPEIEAFIRKTYIRVYRNAKPNDKMYIEVLSHR